MAKRFYLYQRQRNGKSPVWYARFRSVDGSIGSPVSTGQIEKDKAEQWAVEELIKAEAEGQKLATHKPGAPTFEQWASPWWVYDRCPYIGEKIANGYHISKSYANCRRSDLDLYLLPAFGKYRITQLTPAQFRDFKMRLYKEGRLAPSTINKILGTARVMFNYAVEMGELEHNPVGPVKELKEVPRARGILSLEELQTLFASGALETVWRGDLRHYACNLLAASTGLRMGECQALQIQYVHPQYVQVLHSWHDKYGLSRPKWDSTRLAPIPKKTSGALYSLIAMHRWGDPRPEDVVFWGQDRNTPLSKTAILRQFKKALKKIGITETERRRRVLLFHSHRHGFNTLLRSKIPDEQLRRVTGHKTLTMTDSYDAPGIEQLQDVLEAQEGLFNMS